MNARAYTRQVRQNDNLKVAFKKQDLYTDLLKKKAAIAVVGLGYVGLPVALHMASKFKVVGYDINAEKVGYLKVEHDPSGEIASTEFKGKDIKFSAETKVLTQAKFYIVAVPTPIDRSNHPNLNPLVSATKSVAQVLKKGDIVVFESTVYPGCTEEVCVPILESISGLRYNEGFFVGYSPERINPGDTVHTFDSITKIVSGSTPKALDTIAQVYAEVVTAGVHKAPALNVAEAAKVVENIQRDVNIALMNELTYLFDGMDVAIKDVLEAAGTKWNFLNFFPGLVGGHCIGVDPYYLIHKAKEMHLSPSLLQTCRDTNERMTTFLAMKLLKASCAFGCQPEALQVLVKGITFKENVKDVRNSKVVNLIKNLQSFGFNITVEDPLAEVDEVDRMYDIALSKTSHRSKIYDIVVMAVDHKAYHEDLSWKEQLSSDGLIFDIRGTFKKYADQYTYISL
ncbi:nucleotide sugar dehydrogenase [Sediminicola luteus]|uniref:UDP-glucose/GDP-mannose dehydrogenase C-terminal domain-containing protein n=1 Tax=Sediminicola luteus TaxID=319238 RepID=A0A2A4G3M7_9FLAO|nr:nucleotide sugar dehydrogenase [Sediminicola luteus]PCE62566.1 hypothetical protein B7P33_18185 [Sediminicola luteus]